VPDVLDNLHPPGSDPGAVLDSDVDHDGPPDSFGDDRPEDDGGGADRRDDGRDPRDDDDDDTRWVTVATYWTPTDAQIARLRLEGDGIDVVILDENLIATDWLYANAVGGIKLKVPVPDADRARELLVRPGAAAVARNDGQPVSDGQSLCPRCGSPDIYPTHLSRRLSMVALFVCSLLIPFALGPRRTRCAACAYEWR
jgi:hypothetical protein